MSRPCTRIYPDAPWPFPAVGPRLREARLRAGLTQAQVAEAIGLSRPAVINMEAGRQRIQLDHVYRLAALFGCPLSDLLPPLTRGDEAARIASRHRGTTAGSQP